MSVEVKFTDTGKIAKGYTGKPGNWPDGVYQCQSSRGTETVLRAFGSVLHIAGCGSIDTSSHMKAHPEDRWIRISDSVKIASITFAGSMNYPDGKPEGAESLVSCNYCKGLHRVGESCRFAPKAKGGAS